MSENRTPDPNDPRREDSGEPQFDPSAGKRTPEGDALIEALLSGDLEPDSPELTRWLEEHPESRIEIEGMMTIQQELDAAARLRRRVLERAESDDLEQEDRYASLIRHQLSGAETPDARVDATSSPATVTRLIRPRLAAAVLILAAIGAWLGGFFGDSGPITMSPNGIEIIAPEGSVSTIDRFEWKHTRGLAPAGFYRVTVFTESGKFVSEDLFEPSWQPSQNLIASWGSFSYLVEAMRPDGVAEGNSGEPTQVSIERP